MDRHMTEQADRISTQLQQAMVARYQLISDNELSEGLSSLVTGMRDATHPVYAATCRYHASLSFLAVDARPGIGWGPDIVGRELKDDLRAAIKLVVSGMSPIHREFDWENSNDRERGRAILATVIAQNFLQNPPQSEPVCPAGYAKGVGTVANWLVSQLTKLDPSCRDEADAAASHLTILLRLGQPARISIVQTPDDWIVSCLEGTALPMDLVLRIQPSIIELTPAGASIQQIGVRTAGSPKRPKKA